MPTITVRNVPNNAHSRLMSQGVSPLLARLYAARGIQDLQQLDYSLKALIPFHQLKNVGAMASRLAKAIEQHQRLLVVADYDCDGATACAVAVKGLAALGARVDFIVPNRFEYGYGLTPEIVARAAQLAPDIILTVDNGIASIAGVAAARSHGIDVLITDHHLPGETLPDALIVNPNQRGCDFPSKHLAGVGVIFYVLMALRAEMRIQGAFQQRSEPNLAELLDLVALGTIADVVRLDQNNRTLVENGLKRIRSGRMAPGIAALLQVSGRPFSNVNAFDLGFALGPRVNAAGRLNDMSLGISCLLAPTASQALCLAQQLDQLNRERRQIEASMQETALQALANLNPEGCHTLSLYRTDWHQGVVGVVAARLKERFHRPTIVFAPGEAGQIKGSGRSIPGFHLREALDLICKRYPTLILKFGGHAMAVGLTIAEEAFDTFCQAFELTAQEQLPPGGLTRALVTDGSLPLEEVCLAGVEELNAQVWGQGFPAPTFHDVFHVRGQRIVGSKHLKLQLEKEGRIFSAMWFNHIECLPQQIEAVYQTVTNEWQGRKEIQITIEYCSPAAWAASFAMQSPGHF